MNHPGYLRALFALVLAAYLIGIVGVAAAEAQTGNGRIAYVRNVHNGRTDVMSMRPDGTGTLNLTRSTPNELYVDVSPDGRRVAFTRFTPNGGEIFTVGIKGGNLTRLTNDRVHDELPIWSPDSSEIAFVRYAGGEDAEIFVMNADGSDKTRLTFNETGDADPRWSPDGERLIYNGGDFDENTQDVFLVTLGGIPETITLTEPDFNDTFAEWSPDGTSVVYSSLRDEQWDLYVVTADGTATTRLTDDPADDYVPEWSADGTKLMFVRGRLEGNLPADEVYVMNADGTGQASVSPPRLQAFSPDWSPDGTKIVFVGQVGSGVPDWELFRVGVDGAGLTRLTRTGGQEFDPEWGPRQL